MENEITGILEKVNAALEALGVLSPEAFEALVQAEYVGGLAAFWTGISFLVLSLVLFIISIFAYEKTVCIVCGMLIAITGIITTACGKVEMLTAKADVIQQIIGMVGGQ